MTVLEFEAWVSDHYEDLKGIANTVTRRSHSAIDYLHNLIESVTTGERPVPDPIGGTLTGWFATKLAGRARNERGSDTRVQRRLKGRLAQSLLTIGPEETYSDFEQEKKRNTNQGRIRSRQKAKDLGRGADAALVYLNGIAGIEWDGPMSGVVRWRFQTLRDNRLFDALAVRSIAESMHKASARLRHDGWPGYSHTEFGQENAR